MSFDLSGISNGILGMLTSFMFWGGVLVVLLSATIGYLLLRKGKKLIYPLIILTDLGAGKMGINARLKKGAGWFKKKTFFFGLYDYGGEDVLRTWDKREVQNASSEDFHDINGKRGLVVVRKSDDPAILLPINKAGTTNKYQSGKDGDLIPVKSMKITNIDLLSQIAPADYRDASTKIIENDTKETMSKWEKVLPFIAMGGLAIIVLICIIFIVQMVKTSQDQAKDLILEAGRLVLDVSKNVQTSGAP